MARHSARARLHDDDTNRFRQAGLGSHPFDQPLARFASACGRVSLYAIRIAAKGWFGKALGCELPDADMAPDADTSSWKMSNV